MNDPTETRRVKKAGRRQQILLELKLRPHERVAGLAARFGVTTETIRRHVEDLNREGRLRRAHGGASAPYPGSGGDLRGGFRFEADRLYPPPMWIAPFRLPLVLIWSKASEGWNIWPQGGSATPV